MTRGDFQKPVFPCLANDLSDTQNRARRVSGGNVGGIAEATTERLENAARHRPGCTIFAEPCTTLSRLGVDEETAELVIGHLPQGMAKTYNLYDRLAERRAALEQWAEFVQSLAEGKVVPIGKGAAA